MRDPQLGGKLLREVTRTPKQVNNHAQTYYRGYLLRIALGAVFDAIAREMSSSVHDEKEADEGTKGTDNAVVVNFLRTSRM